MKSSSIDWNEVGVGSWETLGVGEPLSEEKTLFSELLTRPRASVGSWALLRHWALTASLFFAGLPYEGF